MSYYEYAIYDLDLSDIDIKDNINKVIQYNIDCISVPYFYTKIIRPLFENQKTIVSNAIDYPFGFSDTKTRNSAIINAIDNGAQKIDIVFQNNYLSNKKYDKLRQDISSSIEICKKYNVPIFFYLEYRIFTHQSLVKACNLLLEFGVDKVYVSTGHMLDDINDNVIAYDLLKQKTTIKPIFTANIWTKNHVATLKKNNISSIRFNNINSLQTYMQYISNEK